VLSPPTRPCHVVLRSHNLHFGIHTRGSLLWHTYSWLNSDVSWHDLCTVLWSPETVAGVVDNSGKVSTGVMKQFQSTAPASLLHLSIVFSFTHSSELQIEINVDVIFLPSHSFYVL
jgi:hypothetical protein